MVPVSWCVQGWGFQLRPLAGGGVFGWRRSCRLGSFIGIGWKGTQISLIVRYAYSLPRGPRTTVPEPIVPNKPKTGHALTFKLDHSSGADYPRRHSTGGKRNVLPKTINVQIAVKRPNCYSDGESRWSSGGVSVKIGIYFILLGR